MINPVSRFSFGTSITELTCTVRIRGHWAWWSGRTCEATSDDLGAIVPVLGETAIVSLNGATSFVFMS